MLRTKAEIDQLTRRLIVKVTGFTEYDENFKACMQFTQSNIRDHQFLSIDSHRVTRQLEGLYTKLKVTPREIKPRNHRNLLCTKLKVHSKGDKAQTLQTLVSSFLDSPLSDQHPEDKKTDAHYSLLSLLCILGQSPTDADYKPATPPPPEDPQEKFDWAAYLLEGEEIFSGYHSDTTSDEGDLESSDEHGEEETTPTLPSSAPAADVSMETIVEPDRGEEWLKDNVIVQYWKGHGRGEIRGPHSSSNLLRDWTSFQLRTEESFATTDWHVVTEYKLIREILWMLSGVDALFLFNRTDAGFRLKDTVRLSHLSGASLESVLGPLTALADRVYALQGFVGEVVSGGEGPDPARPALHSQTYQAFADSLSRVLGDYRRHLSAMEQDVARRDSSTLTVSSMLGQLSPWLPVLEALWEVLSAGVLPERRPPGSEPSAWCSSEVTRLLTALYDQVLLQHSLGSLDTLLVSTLLRVLFETSLPYINIIGQWISAGQLCDPAGEFVLRRDEGVQALDGTFWDRAFTLNAPFAVRPSRSDASVRESLDSTLSSAGRCAEGEVGWEGVVEEVVGASPRFLRPVMLSVLLTGKSMELLQALGRLPQVQSGSFKNKTLYQLFVGSLKDVLGTQPPQTEEPPSEEEEEGVGKEEEGVGKKEGEKEKTTPAAPHNPFAQNLQTNARYVGTRDPLLRLNFEAVFSTLLTADQPGLARDSDPDHGLGGVGRVEAGGSGPLELLFERCLYTHVSDRYRLVCARLPDIMKTEFSLLDYLHSMQLFFFMSAGDAMFDFYTQVFDKMRHQEVWNDPYPLTLALQEAMQSRYQHVERLYVSIEPLPEFRERIAVAATDAVRLNLNVPWPVNVVISSKSQNLYNQVFRFLMQIKRAKYGLDQLRFKDLDKTALLTVTSAGNEAVGGGGDGEAMSRSERLHRLHVLRFRLSYFVSSLHDYIMTRILHSSGLEFAAEIKEATDLQQVIDLHARYIGTIHEQCLLHKKLSFLKDAVTQVLNLTLSFAMRWDQGIHNISGRSVLEMETELSRCIKFLSSFLNNIIKRGSFPFVVQLTFALVTSLPSGTGEQLK